MITGMSPNERISGLALEPSWLAAQVTALYLPWAFTALIRNYHWNRRRWLAVLILLACAFLMVFTYSRSGILTAAAVVAATLVLTGGSRIRQIWQWLTGPFRTKDSTGQNRFLRVALRVAILVVIAGGVVVGALVLGRNEYFATLWQAIAESNSPLDYLINIYAGPRLAYAYAGWQVFAAHLWTGVGLGGLGLYIHAQLPDWSHFNMPEIARLLASSNTTYPNSKNLYIRLLAETGIFGFWLFVSFYLFVLGKTLKLLRSSSKEMIFVGVAGLCSWLAIVTLGMSQDSFAMPTIWIPLGIVLGLAEARK
jgi:O-antigen ligase